jgi:hypothetical protein
MTLTDRVVHRLDLGEERIESFREPMPRTPERQVPSGHEERMRFRVADRGIDPVPCGRGVHEVELLIPRVPGLECTHIYGHRIACEVAPSMRCEVVAELDADNLEPRLHERQGRLPVAQPISSSRAPERSWAR